jgi:RNA polymerase sigma-70 factor (ECF subfamily)
MSLRKAAGEAEVTDSAFWMTTFERHGSAVMAFLASRTGRRDLAEDLLQETFVRAMRARPTLPDASGVRSYLFTTAHNLLLSRRRKKRPSLFSEALDDETRALERIADTKALSPERTADLHRFEERLHGVLAELPPVFRTAFEQAVLQQRSYHDIASEQGWTLAQVKTNVHRARKKVIAALGDLLGERRERR